jgi:hypothetical protein
MKVPPNFVPKRTCGALVNSACDAVVDCKKAAFATISETCANLADCFAPWHCRAAARPCWRNHPSETPEVSLTRAHGWVATCRAMSPYVRIGNLIDRSYATPRGLSSPSTGRSIFIAPWMSSAKSRVEARRPLPPIMGRSLRRCVGQRPTPFDTAD